MKEQHGSRERPKSTVGEPLDALMSLTALLTVTREVDTVIQRALAAALDFSGHDQGSIMLAAHGRLVIRAVVGQDPAMIGTTVKDVEQSIAGWVLRNRRPVYLEGPARPPADLKLEYTKDLASSICLPLLTPSGSVGTARRHPGAGRPGTAIGVLSLNAVHRAAKLSAENIEVLQALANHVAIAIDNAHLYEALHQKERQLQKAASDLVGAQDEERRRVAYEIHDGLAQLLVGAYHRLQAYRAHHAPRSPRAKADLEQLDDQLKGCIGEVRQVISDLRPTMLDDFGLELAVKRHLELLSQETGWEVDFQADLKGKPLPPPVETAAYRIIQEAASNARRHARSPRLAVLLKRRPDRLLFQVRDWGVGIGKGATTSGLGLTSMSERAMALGGSITIKSSQRHGTRIAGWLPVSHAAGGGTERSGR